MINSLSLFLLLFTSLIHFSQSCYQTELAFCDAKCYPIKYTIELQSCCKRKKIATKKQQWNKITNNNSYKMKCEARTPYTCFFTLLLHYRAYVYVQCLLDACMCCYFYRTYTLYYLLLHTPYSHMCASVHCALLIVGIQSHWNFLYCEQRMCNTVTQCCTFVSVSFSIEKWTVHRRKSDQFDAIRFIISTH